MSDEYEFELTTGREEAAAVLRGVADGVRAGSVRVSDGASGATVDVPEELELEVELEDEEGELSLEVELSWPAPADDAPAFTRVETVARDGPSASVATETETDAPGSADTSGTAESEDDGVASAESAGEEDASADSRGSLARFELFRDSADEWRWRLRHRNGNIIATSGEGYTRKHNARKGLRSVAQNAPAAPVTEAGEE